jgi:hypothetical protein
MYVRCHTNVMNSHEKLLSGPGSSEMNVPNSQVVKSVEGVCANARMVSV